MPAQKIVVLVTRQDGFDCLVGLIAPSAGGPQVQIEDAVPQINKHLDHGSVVEATACD